MNEAHRRIRRPPVCRLLLVGALWCAAPRSMVSQGAPLTPQRNTAMGVVMLTHPADAFAKAPAMSLGPLIARAGGADAPEWDLTNVDNVVLLRDGRIVALSAVGNRFYRFSASGKPEKVLSRQGAGPGEIMAPMGIGRLPGDTLFIGDPSNRRISWFGPNGYVRGVAMPSAGGFMNTAAVGALRDGRLVMRDFGAYPDPRKALPRERIAVRVYLLPASGARIRTIAELPDLEFAAVTVESRGKASRMPQVIQFTRAAHVAAWDTAVVTSSADGYRVDIRDSTGVVRRVLAVAAPRRAITAVMRDADIQRRLGQSGSGGGEASIFNASERQRLAETAPTADSLPGFDALHVSHDQMLWIVDARSPLDAGGGATAFRQDGAISGRLTWRGSGVPVAFGTDRVVMKETDDDGVVSLAVYRLQRR